MFDKIIAINACVNKEEQVSRENMKLLPNTTS